MALMWHSTWTMGNVGPRKVLDKVVDGTHVWRAHGPGGCGIRHCSSQVLGVLEVVGNGEHDLHLIATAGHHMVTVQGLLDEEWKTPSPQLPG